VPKEIEMAMEKNQRYAPYLAWRTFFNLIQDLEQGPMPARIDRSYLSGRSGTDQAGLIATLKAWGLIGQDDNKAEPRLLAIVQDRDNRPDVIAEILKEQYPEVFALDPNATQSQLDETFREVFDLQGDTVRKAETFFLHAASYAGLKLSPHYKAVRGVEGGAQRRRTRRTLRRQTPPPPPTITVESQADPDEARRQRYFELLVKKADEGDDDGALLDRIERLLGMQTDTQGKADG
jgi:hypothetical protein